MKTLVVIDMQNDFIDGVLGTPEAVSIVPKVKEKVVEYYKKGYKVIFTQDTHFEDYLYTQEGRHLPIEHCLWNTHGWEITKEITDVVHPIKTVKKRTFGYDKWGELLDLSAYFDKDENFRYVDEIELVGLCTDICVISNAILLKVAFPEIPITVDASCCAGTTPENHKNALKAMKMCQVEIRGE